jgi:cobalt-zinc-cadmium efflux system outer membrane protein
MKTKCKYLILLVILPFAGRPQASLDSVIAAVQATNATLIVSRLQMDAEMKAARTGIYLPNPEVQFDYLWGDPVSSGNRTDFGVTQSFSFPSVYVQRSNQSGLLKTGASLKYLQKEREVIMKAKSAWINIVGLNKLLTIFDHRIRLADEIAQQAKLQLSRGEINVIRYHHARMEFVNLKMERTELEVQHSTLLTQLTQLCGGKFIPVPDTAYPAISAYSMNEIMGYFAGTPSVKSLENEIDVRHMNKNIIVSEWLPKFKAGYYSEVVTGLRYQGIQTGISIPLWQNINSVKTADYQMKVATAELDQMKSQETARIVSLFNKRDKLAGQVQEIRSALLPVNDVSLLKKALDVGEINIFEFYYECSVFYSAWFNLLKTEKDLALTEAELLYAAGR